MIGALTCVAKECLQEWGLWSKHPDGAAFVAAQREMSNLHERNESTY